jgi:prepilin-type N-terminal cleavage/methylation domain-containing protein/prepilin-type processing-associated H-X9-DG protein
MIRSVPARCPSRTHINRFHPSSPEHPKEPLMPRMFRRRAFTLTELLAVIAIIGVVVGLLLPAIAHVRKAAAVTRDLNNLRNLQLAHQAYMGEHDFRFVDMNMLHTSDIPAGQPAWLTLLQEHYVTPLSLRSPLDASPHWPRDQGGDGLPLPTASSGGYQFRRTSYGCNGFLSPQGISSEEYAVIGDVSLIFNRMSKIRNPVMTVDFVLMAETGDFAGSDHVHPEQWDDAAGGGAATTEGLADAAAAASLQMHTAAVGGRAGSGDARSNYGFLDGHVETFRFVGLYLDAAHNAFDPSKVPALLNLKSTTN